MTGALETLETIGVFAVGALARIGIFLAVVAALAAPLVLVAWGLERLRQLRRRTLGLHDAGGVTLRRGARYAPGHTWLREREEGVVELGADALALRLLPAVTAVDPGRSGAAVRRGETVVTLWGGGRKLAVRAPFDARIVGVNAAVVRDPALVRSDGYGRGWLVALEPASDAWRDLPAGDRADAWMRAEAHRWNAFIEARLGIAGADGGEPIEPTPWVVGEACWKDLVQAFTDPDARQ